MSHISLQCSECAVYHHADMTTLHCVQCGSVLDVAYSLPEHQNETSDLPTPLHHLGDAIALGEGNTPSVNLDSIGKRLGVERLYAKLEMMNPTGSFKDRGTAVMMSVAKEFGVSEVVEDSSGNAGASVAAYAARAGIQAHIFAPSSAPVAKVSQIEVYGARTHLIDGDRQAVTDAAIDFAERNDMVYASHNLSPYFTEGTKTFAYEVADQFDEDLPRHIVIPVGNGSLLIGAHRGFVELRNCGRISAIPKLHAVQASAVMPLAAAFIDESQPAPTAGTHDRRRYSGCQPAASAPIAARLARNGRFGSRGGGVRHCALAASNRRAGGHIRRADISRGVRRSGGTHRQRHDSARRVDSGCCNGLWLEGRYSPPMRLAVSLDRRLEAG